MCEPDIAETVLRYAAWTLVGFILLALAFGGHTVRIPKSPRVGK